MSVDIHPTAVISPRVQIGTDVAIGPYSVIESDVCIGDRCRIVGKIVCHVSPFVHWQTLGQPGRPGEN